MDEFHASNINLVLDIIKSIAKYNITTQQLKKIFRLLHTQGNHRARYANQILVMLNELYEATDSRCSHISFSLRGDGGILVNLYDKDEEKIKQILIARKNGEILHEMTDFLPYSEVESYNDTANVRLDEQSFLPEGASYVLGYGNRMADVQPYIFYLSDNAIWCLDGETGEAWKMKEIDGEYIQSVCTDGEYFYAISIAKSPSVYQIIKDQDGSPGGCGLLMKRL